MRLDNVGVDITRREAVRRGVRLEILTIAWMVAEAVIAIGAGIAARSVLLTAFGVDSVVELLSALVLYRRLSEESAENVARLERNATRVSAVLLVLLCGYVVLSSIAGVVFRIKPEGSPLGVAVALAALIGMPLLARAKRRVNRVLQSPSLRADIAETASCAYLAGVTLAGLLASGRFGWWWAQYVAAIALLVWLLPETREALQEARNNGFNPTGEGAIDER